MIHQVHPRMGDAKTGINSIRAVNGINTDGIFSDPYLVIEIRQFYGSSAQINFDSSRETAAALRELADELDAAWALQDTMREATNANMAL